ncbi:MAG: iron-sulfur cluster assembly accessory protein, partial [Verrucomicrobiota bacterium]
MITVTSSAVNHLRVLLGQKEADPTSHGLRLGVERGGCAGMQYTMKVSEPEPTDQIIEAEDLKFFIAEDSREFLEGCELDFEDTLSFVGFRVNNP